MGECNHECNHCLVIAGVALLAVVYLAGIRTPATLRSDAAFIAANRMAAPPILAADVIYTAAGGLALGTDGPALIMIVGVVGTGRLARALAGGGCAGFSCRCAG